MCLRGIYERALHYGQNNCMYVRVSIIVHLSPGSSCGYSLTQVRVVITTCGMRGHLGVVCARLRVDLLSTLALPLQENSTHQNHS